MKNYLYKWVIDDVTDYCYKNCLDYFPKNSNILDVGIGNGVMIKNHHDLIKSKGFKIVGIDINKSYLDHCDRLIQDYGLDNQIAIYHQPVETYHPQKQSFFNFILFSMSFMLIDDQTLVLKRVKDWLRPNGEIVFFQTMFKERSRFVEFVKPKLKYITTIDFGRVTYEKNFFALLDEEQLSVSEDRLIKREWFKGEYRMIATAFKNGTSGDFDKNQG